MRALQDRRLMETERGHIAMGWLVVQDLLTVLVLVVLPPLAGLLKGEAVNIADLSASLGLTFAKLAVFAGLMLVIGRRVIPAILHYIAHTGSRELFRLAVLSVALGVAFVAAALFGVSIALGAFFAGMILAGSPLSQRAAEESLPLRDAFAVLFFVSVGMLFDPHVLVRQPVALAVTVLIVLGGGVAAYLLMRFLGVGARNARIALSLAQIGEFSFILADLGTGLGVLPPGARGLILGASILSILINPLLFAFVTRKAAPKAAAPEPAPLTPTLLNHHAVLVGYGRVGERIAQSLRGGGVELLVVEEGVGMGEKLAAHGHHHIIGNAVQEPVLRAANIAGARLLYVAIPENFEAGQIVQQARRANPDLVIVARAHFDAGVGHLMGLGANRVVMGEEEIANAMLHFAPE